MKRGSMDYLVQYLKNIVSTSGFCRVDTVFPSPDEIDKDYIFGLIKEERRMDSLLESIKPGDTLFLRDLDVIEFSWFEQTVIEVDMEKRIIRTYEPNSFGLPRKVLSGYELGKNLLTKEEYEKG